jgi:hypothetical protein
VALGNALEAMRSERLNSDIMGANAHNGQYEHAEKILQEANAEFEIGGIFNDDGQYEKAEKSLLGAVRIYEFLSGIFEYV